MRYNHGPNHPSEGDRYVLVSKDEYNDYLRYRNQPYLHGPVPPHRYGGPPPYERRYSHSPYYDEPVYQSRYHEYYPPEEGYRPYSTPPTPSYYNKEPPLQGYRPTDSVYYDDVDELEPRPKVNEVANTYYTYTDSGESKDPVVPTVTVENPITKPVSLGTYSKLNRDKLYSLVGKPKKNVKPKCPLDDITLTSANDDEKADTDKVTFTIDKSTKTSKAKSDETKPMAFVLPVQNKPLDKPSEESGIFSMLFPQLQSKKTEPEPVPDLPKHDRTKFINGLPIDTTIDTLEDLIKIGEDVDNKFDKDTTYSLDLESLRKMLPCLHKLRGMIGLEDIKNKIIHQVLFYLQGLDESNKDMLHTVIEGDPGVGKTEIAKILGEIYCSLGILTKGTFTSVKRADLVGSYLGQTASKTLKVLEASRGGVLFIDEAYSLGNDEGKDIYSKECIDTITAYLSENRENFVCVIAGYKDALKKCFFKHNAGLERRFPWRYSIKGYSEAELKQIFEKIVTEHEWKTEITLKFFEEHMDKFKNYGGDMENLFHKSKLAHSMRALSLEPSLKKNITMEDINQGLKLFIEEEEEKEKKTSAWMMYT